MDLRINLASRPYLNRRAVWHWLLLLGGGLLLVLIINLNFGLTNYQHLRQLEARHAELDQQLSGLKGVAGQYSPEKFEQIRKQVDSVNRLILADEFQWTVLLNRLEELVPDDVSISSIQPDYKARGLRMEGVAKDVSAMMDLLDRLLASNDLNQVYLLRQAETEKRDRRTNLVAFSLEIREAF